MAPRRAGQARRTEPRARSAQGPAQTGPWALPARRAGGSPPARSEAWAGGRPRDTVRAEAAGCPLRALPLPCQSRRATFPWGCRLASPRAGAIFLRSALGKLAGPIFCFFGGCHCCTHSPSALAIFLSSLEASGLVFPGLTELEHQTVLGRLPAPGHCTDSSDTPYPKLPVKEVYLLSRSSGLGGRLLVGTHPGPWSCSQRTGWSPQPRPSPPPCLGPAVPPAFTRATARGG